MHWNVDLDFAPPVDTLLLWNTTVNELTLHRSAQLIKYLVYVLSCLSTAFHILHPVGASQRFGLFPGNFPGLGEVLLVADEEDAGLVAGGVGEVLHPLLWVSERVHTE